MMSTAAAPSEICDEVPAVTVPVLAEGRLERRPASRARCRGGCPRHAQLSDAPPLRRARRGALGPRGGRSRWRSGPRRWRRRPAGATRRANSSISLAADVPAPGDLLGALALVDQLEPLQVQRAVGLARPRLGRRADGHPAHRLDPGPDGHVHGAGHAPPGRRSGWPAAPSRTGGRPWCPGTDSGKPAARAALRAMFIACSPTVMVQPMITSSTSAGSRSLRAMQGSQRLGGQIGGVPPREAAPAAAHRGADGVDDHGSGHREANFDAESAPDARCARRRRGPGARGPCTGRPSAKMGPEPCADSSP